MASRGIYASTVFDASSAMINQVHDLWNTSITPAVSNAANLTYVLVFQSIPPVGIGNLMGLDPAAHPEKTLVLCLLSNFWSNNTDTATITAATKGLVTEIETAAKERGAFHDYQYLNYAAGWQDPIASYGTSQVAKLKAVSAKYDPKGLFQSGVSGPFKLK